MKKIKAALNCFKEPITGIVHIKMSSYYGGGEYTLCGDAYDRPLSEDGESVMVDSDEVCNCEKCIAIAERLLPILKKELRRIEARNEARSFG